MEIRDAVPEDAEEACRILRRAIGLPQGDRHKMAAPLTIAEAGEVAEVIRAAFAAQRRPTSPPSSALRETGETIATLRVRLALPENEKLFQRLGFARLSLETHAGFDAPTSVVMEKRLS